MTTSSFGYNGLDARVSKTDSTGTFSFKRNGAGVTDPELSDGAATYTPGISERRAGSSKFLHSGMKNADAQSGASANVDSSRTYDAFGNLTGSSGTWSGPFGYAGGFGYQEDPDHGLRLLGHRYYDSSTGRFISKDPIGDGRNWTSYGAGETAPTHFADPDGLRLGSLLKAGKALWDFLKGLGTRKPPAAKPKPAASGNAASQGVATLTGQVHHAISKKVHRALQEHKNLRGLYKERDPRFTSRAQRLEDHNGYDEWHRAYDREVVEWIRSNPNATKEQFEAYLNRLFSQPDMHRRFPQGLKNESTWKNPKKPK